MPGGDPLATCTLPVGVDYLLTYLLPAGSRLPGQIPRVPGARPRIPEARNGRAPGPGAGGRSDEAYPPLEQRNAGRDAWRHSRENELRYYDSSLLAASYPNYIDPISLHISSLSRDWRRGLCGPTPGLCV